MINLDIDYNKNIGQKCWKCGGKMRSKKNMAYSITRQQFGHIKCSRFSWANRCKNPKYRELWAEYQSTLY